MSRIPNNALTVRCPACGAEPGQRCKTISGHVMPEAHTKRKHAAPPQNWAASLANSRPATARSPRLSNDPPGLIVSGSPCSVRSLILISDTCSSFKLCQHPRTCEYVATAFPTPPIVALHNTILFRD
jgi:hypothetical protein